MASPSSTTTCLPKSTNQALGISQFAIDFVNNKFGDSISKDVYEKVKLFHSDSVMCGVSALALQTNAPTILRREALNYPRKQCGACVFGSSERCAPEKAIVANASAVREWDSNGTVFGYHPSVEAHRAGEFGHNDFYPVVIAAAQANPTINGHQALRAMICLDEIRGRLCEVFSLKTHKIDHVLHGAIASAAVYGALMGATAEQIESAIGMTVAHYVPWRAIRHGKQLSDSKGASAAISTEVAILSMQRAMCGFVGPKDILRNQESVFCWTTKPKADESPFDLVLAHSGSEFAVCGMHFKLGLYEHQSAGALQGLISILCSHPEIYQSHDSIDSIVITAYEPAFGIIGDPAKRDPRTRQSADHSMVYIVSSMLRKAIELGKVSSKMDDAWKQLMLSPYEYSREAITHPLTRKLMGRISFVHGGHEFDSRYPDGIPTSIDIKIKDRVYSSGLVMYPVGHSRNAEADVKSILQHKFQMLGDIAMEKEECARFLEKLGNIDSASPAELQEIYNFKSLRSHPPIDG